MGIFDVVDAFYDLGRLFRGERSGDRPVDSSELRVRSQMAEDDAASSVEAARMLAFEKQEKKCARCGIAIQEGSPLRLVSSEKGFEPGNVILVCDVCEKMMKER